MIRIYLLNFAPEKWVKSPLSSKGNDYVHENDTAKVIKMVEKIVIITLIIAIAIAFLCVKVLFRRNGSFSSMHIHDSKAMKDRGIHCVIDQDREMRMRSRLAVNEKSK